MLTNPSSDPWMQSRPVVSVAAVCIPRPADYHGPAIPIEPSPCAPQRRFAQG